MIQLPDYQDIDQNPIPVVEKPAPDPWVPGSEEEEIEEDE